MRRLRLPAAALGALVVLTGCADDAELDTLTDLSGPEARSIDTFMNYIWPITGIVFVLVLGMTVAAWAKFRVKDYDDDTGWPEQIHGNTTLEVVWTGIPIVIMTAMAIASLILLGDLNGTEANAFAVDYEEDGTAESVQWEPRIVVVGQQWWWEFRYYLEEASIEALDEVLDNDPNNPALNLPPADIVTSGQMIIPINQEVELDVLSRDVIHSFWIPSLNGKRDAVPGRANVWKIESSNPGIFFGQCTEFCGLSHSRMQMQVEAMTETDFEAWITRQLGDAPVPSGAEAWLEATRADAQATLDAEEAGNDPPAPTAEAAPAETAEQRGLTAFLGNCASCHLVRGVNEIGYDGAAQVAGVAPELTHLASRTTFAGGILPLYVGTDKAAGFELNRNDLEAWIRNPDAIKANAADEQRGMPALGLDDDTIDDIVAYLATLGEPPTAAAVLETQVD